jgi:sulfotransferase
MNEITINKKIIYVTGLPRSGSTLLCQLLGHHPDVYSTGHSSPLAHAIDNTRHSLSNDDFMLSQMDGEFDLVYNRMRNAYRGLINGWMTETDKPVVVEKNRGWLGMIQLMADLDPDFKMLVCIRDLGQIWGSIENQNRKTILIDTGDRMASLTPQGRGARLFNEGGLVAVPLGAILAALNELPPNLRERVHFVRFDRLTHHTTKTMEEIFAFYDLPKHEIDPAKLNVNAGESDSYYRFKYPHKTYNSVHEPDIHWVPEKVATSLKNQYQWYYETFYPQLL